MKRVTASEARANWFRLLDEVAAGEAVAIDRNGVRIVIRREADSARGRAVPDYTGIIAGPDLGDLDRWGWEWDGPETELQPVRKQRQ
jgi:antitoxin (DNA-binding transcriptional repressor) of toxin-antitoxin stability system